MKKNDILNMLNAPVKSKGSKNFEELKKQKEKENLEDVRSGLFQAQNSQNLR
jgi:hypothetical protein